MADVRWKDKTKQTTLALTDRIPVTTGVGVSNTDKYYTPVEMAVSVLDQGGTLGAKLTAGAIEIEGSAFDINGGTSDGLVINSGSIGSTTPITKLNVDNIQVDGNTISSTAGVDLNITPLAGQQVVIDGAVIIDAGVVTGVTDLTATDANITNLSLDSIALAPTATELNYVNGVASQLAGLAENHSQSYVTATAASVGMNGKEGTINFDTTANAIFASLPEITTGKSEEYLCIFGTDSGENVTITDHASDSGFVKADGTTTGISITLDDVDDFILLKSSSIEKGYWMILGGIGYTLNS